ncbi:response regulator transcription factor [Candidatus Margulisiibacteriota bacterium]
MSEKKRILVVEDELQHQEIIKMVLEEANYEIIFASDGQEALEKARQEKPDLMLLDLMIPKIDGYKVCQMLKFDEDYKNIPIIILSAKNEEEDKELAKKTGADGYITKPFDFSFLVKKVKEFLEPVIEHS